jgi:hypothetical protein
MQKFTKKRNGEKGGFGTIDVKSGRIVWIERCGGWQNENKGKTLENTRRDRAKRVELIQ